MPETRTRETKKQSEDVSPHHKKRALGAKADVTQPDISPGSTRFMQRYLGNARMSAITGLQRKLAFGRGVGKQGNTGMPDSLKTGIENLSGMPMDDVSVHYNSAEPATLQALAYTQGTDIHVAPGQEQHLPHEAWHVVQQGQNRVKPTTRAKGVAINDDSSLEGEADRMGEEALKEGASKSESKADQDRQDKRALQTLQKQERDVRRSLRRVR